MRIGLMLRVLNDSFCLKITKLISQEVRVRNADLILFEAQSFENNTPRDFSSNILSGLISHESLDGLVILSDSLLFDHSRELLENFAHKLDIPVAAMGIPLEGITSVALDNAKGSGLLVDHLVSHGFSKMALIGGPPNHPETEERRDAFISAARRNGLNIDEAFILDGNFGYPSGYNQAAKLVPHIKNGHIDAVVCTNDTLAYAATRCFNENHIRIPEDAALVSFDDTGLACCSIPPLTAAAPPLEAMCKTVVTALFDQINGRKSSGTITVSPELILRRSCGCANQEATDFSSINAYIGTSRLNTLVSLGDAEEFPLKLTNFLEENSIRYCFIIKLAEALAFDANSPAGSLKCSISFGYAKGNTKFGAKAFPLADILPRSIMDSINEPMLLKPLFLGRNQFGFLFVSACDAIASSIESLETSLCHYFESLCLEEERRLINKKLVDTQQSLRISNQRLNELTVRENLDKLSNTRYLAANMFSKRLEGTTEYGLIIAEIDNFTEISSFGFSEGESAIANVSDILSKSIRDGDVLSHQSCERYVILLRNIKNNPVKAITERFIQGMGKLNRAMGKPYSISLSWGSSLANVDSDFNTVYKQAEQNLAEFKQHNVSHKAL